MASGGFFRGTSVDQDSRFFNQTKKLLAKLSFPPCFDQRVDLSKVKREVISQWITERVTQLLGFEDDIVVAMIINLLEPKVDERLDPRQMQLTITGFLEKDAPVFMKELWELLLSAQAHPTGIPPAILKKKKQEMAKLAQDKQTLRLVLNRKQQEARATAPQRDERCDAQERPQKQYGLTHRGQDRHHEENQRRDERPRPRSPVVDHGRRERLRSPRRHHRRSPSYSRSRSRSPSRSRSRSPSRSRRRRPSRSRRSRSDSRDSRLDRSPSSSPDRRRKRSRSPRRERRRRSPSRSPSPDPFGRRPRPAK